MQEAPVKILLVEDDPDDVWIMRNSLSDRWDAPFELVHVEFLSAAVARCAEDRFDVVLLDLSLPDSSGLETFFTMYANSAGVPIVILSNFGDEATAVKAVQSGAQDYLVKSDVNDRVLVRSIRYAIERNRRSRLERSRQAAPEASHTSQEIQQRMRPTNAPALRGFDIAGGLRAAENTAGDCFDYIPMLDGCLGVVVGDVSSHGVGPAMLMSETRACLRTLAQASGDVGDILTRMNRMLATDAVDSHFVTLVMARIDPRSRSLVYASAGLRGYLLHPGIDVTILDSTSPPLGVQSDAVIAATAAIPLNPGDLLVFFTDGIVKAESPNHMRFGVARTLQTVRSDRNKPASEIVASLHEEVASFCRNQPAQDDIATVVIKVLEPG